MATTNALKLSMASMNGTKTISLNYARPAATLAQATTLANAIVANTAIFSETYTGLRTANLVTTTTTELV